MIPLSMEVVDIHPTHDISIQDTPDEFFLSSHPTLASLNNSSYSD